MVASTENGRYIQTEVVPLEEYGDSEQSPKQSKGIANYRWLKTVKPQMLAMPYVLKGSDGYPDGMMSDEYVYERLRRILVKQLKLTSWQEVLGLLSNMWAYHSFSCQQEKNQELENLRHKLQEDLARIELLQKELNAVNYNIASSSEH